MHFRCPFLSNHLMSRFMSEIDNATPGYNADLFFTSLSPAVCLHPALWMVDHTTSIMFRYLSSFYTATKLRDLVTEVHACQRLSAVVTQQCLTGNRTRNLYFKPDALPLRPVYIVCWREHSWRKLSPIYYCYPDNASSPM